jgi:hypothetical protein
MAPGITYEIQAFPPLKDAGGIELLRTSGPYSKSLIVIESKHINNVAKLKEFVDQAKVYVRPLQVDLPLSDEDDEEGNKVLAIHIDTLHFPVSTISIINS